MKFTTLFPPFALSHVGVCVLIISSHQAALAQTPRPDAGQLLRDVQPAPLAAPPAARPLISNPAQPAPALPAAHEQVTVQRIALEGNSRITSAELDPLLASVQGKSLPFSQVQAAVASITAYYRAKGYFLARAFIPRQAMQGGVLRVQIVEGSIGEINAADTSATPAASKELLQNILAAQGLQAGQSMQEAPLERAILLFADRGYVDAHIGLSPGVNPGTTAVSMRWREKRAPFAATLGLDNNGSRYTGAGRALADAYASSLLSQGDDLSLRTSVTGWLGGKDNGQEKGSTQYISLGYRALVGYDGWRAGLQASTLAYELGGAFAALQATGRASTFGISASYPLHLSASRQSLLDISMQQRRVVDDSLAGNVNHKSTHSASLVHNLSHSGTLSEGGKNLDQRLQTTLSAGQLKLSRNLSADALDAANAQTRGKYAKLRFDYIGNYAVAAGHQLQARASQQWSSKNLDSSEKISLGGSGGLRAYPTGEANGDGATLLSLEWRADISAFASAKLGKGLSSSLSAFVDWGHIKQNQSPWAAAVASSITTGIPNTYSLAGAGIGLSLARPGSWQLSATVAAPIGDNPGRSLTGNNSDGRGQHSRAWLSFQKSL